jgi:hypothetical protein
MRIKTPVRPIPALKIKQTYYSLRDKQSFSIPAVNKNR